MMVMMSATDNVSRQMHRIVFSSSWPCLCVMFASSWQSSWHWCEQFHELDISCCELLQIVQNSELHCYKVWVRDSNITELCLHHNQLSINSTKHFPDNTSQELFMKNYFEGKCFKYSFFCHYKYFIIWAFLAYIEPLEKIIN